jgi:hypothetical protein
MENVIATPVTDTATPEVKAPRTPKASPSAILSLSALVESLQKSGMKPEARLAKLQSHPLYELEPSPAKKAWATIRLTKTQEQISAIAHTAGLKAKATRIANQAEKQARLTAYLKSVRKGESA